jgi:hypothetical protein
MLLSHIRRLVVVPESLQKRHEWLGSRTLFDDCVFNEIVPLWGVDNTMGVVRRNDLSPKALQDGLDAQVLLDRRCAAVRPEE